MNKNYASYLYKRWKTGWLFYGVMYVLIPAATVLLGYRSRYAYTADVDYAATATMNAANVKAAMILIMVIAILSCYVLPVFMFSYLHRKRSVDLFLSLPISRKEQIQTEFGVMYAAIMGGFIVSSLIAGACGLMLQPTLIHYGLRMLALFAHMFLYIGVLLLFNSMLYMIANNILDGVIMLGAYTLLPFIIQFVWNAFLTSMTVSSAYFGGTMTIGQWLSPFYLGFINAQYIVEPSAVMGVQWSRFSWLYEAILLGYGILAYILNQKLMIQRKAERAEQLSDSLMAYPFVVHIMLFLGLLLVTSSYESDGFTAALIYLMIMLCLYVSASFIYRRRIVLKPRIFIIFIAMCLTTGLISAVGWKTRGFGMIYPVNLSKSQNVEFSYNAFVNKDDFTTSLGADDEQTLNVMFDGQLSYEDWMNNAELQKIFNTHMEESIPAMYEQKTAYITGASMTINSISGSRSSGYSTSNTHQYGLPEGKFLSLEELKTISKYIEVDVTSYDDGESMTLQQYLQKEGK
ncbi:hypothetical protein [Lactimicrobium sp.]